MTELKVVEGDITTIKVDAIVNAANDSLAGGSGVDGAIHRAAGPRLGEACQRLGGCPTGEAKTTPGFNLPAKWIIHTPGPIWRGGQANEAQLLANSYRHSLQEAVAHGCQTVAFPSISTGVYGYPLDRAVLIAIKTVRQFTKKDPRLAEVFFVAFDSRTAAAYRRALQLS
ncbi:MAG: O-acetyl-ADP-ribose deacetylase [[Lactobacillus] timonensis]|jgi:O-acetyl-ADP-ribose deacetylase (regulator of RNase III)|uniref:O-acetyl-ADP-ribose deacetylase n=1 Tax=[Lactobacillus] timonensis TaxID=1970790 RepID=UPI0023569B67|nr:O-acetyl-ADP-ribose deacetylase [[Lactobacillus] timonensis]MCI1925455.1 O-acetyl-ADP-ribose deacetylase [[Lactobacillus] timonensis]MCI1956793.1 O-acetyl-ADP-ribose deacetylase [[Lactobacillus] timonensis]MCI1969783.1 O-acetyl-ADP-ribose deacetylase [[Lactobacillus] timonensis]MCI2006004.1 O-acetyl-ADP-ribose deacetylase [[Lactobacillus] timonensis]